MIKSAHTLTDCFIFLFSIVMLLSCSSGTNEDYAVGKNPLENALKDKQNQINTSLANANKIISDREKQRIESFINRRGWQMKEVAGIYLQVIEEGRGEITNRNIVTIEYNSYYLNGQSADEFNQNKKEKTQKFSNDTVSQNNRKTFSLQGDTYVVYGLTFAMPHLKNHSSARIIVPDNLAFYMDDNGEKIKANATLVYELKVLDIR